MKNLGILNSIKNKLLALFLFFSTITVLESYYCYTIFKEREQSVHTRELIHDIDNEFLQLNKLQLQFLVYDAKSKSYFNKNTSLYIKKYLQQFDSLKQYIFILKQNYTKNDVDQQKLNTLLYELENFNKDHNLLVSLVKERGFRDYGIEGKMRKAIHAVENYQNYINQTTLLTIRRHEKDYFLRKDTIYITGVDENVNKLLEQVQKSTMLPSESKEALTTLLTEYTNQFHNWVKIDSRIGIDQANGLYLKIKNCNLSIEKAMAEIISDNNDYSKNLLEKYTLVFFLTIVCSTVLCLILSFYLSSYFTNPIIQLSTQIKEVVSGNFVKREIYAIEKSTDEIGVLFNNFNWMINQVHVHIGEVKSSQEKSQAKDRKFRALIEQSSDMKFMISLEGIILYGSPSITKVLGFEEHEYLGKNALDFFYDADWKANEKVIEEIRQNEGGTFTLLKNVRHKNGDLLWLEGTITNLLNDPLLNAIVCNFQDITYRKITEEKILASERKFKSLIDNSNDVITLISNQSEIIYTSPSTNHILNYAPSELVGLNIQQLINKEDIVKFQVVLKEIIHLPRIVKSLQFQMKDKKGNWLWMEGQFSNLLNEPNIEAIVINYRDITIEKLDQIKITEQNNELKKINLELDNFVYSASHDLKAPLTSILGIVGVAKVELDMNASQMYWSMVEKSVKKLLDVIKDLTNVSRNARLEIKCELINFKTLIEESIESLNFLENADQIAFDIDVDENHHPFYSDSLRISILLNNIISNAIIYHDTTKVNPFINVKVKFDAQSAIINIQDNGKGIDKEYFEKIFDMFFRASTNSVGSGLGLYIVKGIVEKLNGQIEVQSKMEYGSEFIFCIPNIIAVNTTQRQLLAETKI